MQCAPSQSTPHISVRSQTAPLLWNRLWLKLKTDDRTNRIVCVGGLDLKDQPCGSHVKLSKTFPLSSSFCLSTFALKRKPRPADDALIILRPWKKGSLFTHTVGFTRGEWTKAPTVACLNLDLSFSIHALQCFTSFSHLTRLFHQTELPASLNEVQLLITLPPAPLSPSLPLPYHHLSPPLSPFLKCCSEGGLHRKKTTLSCAGNYLWSCSTVKNPQDFFSIKQKRSLMQWVTISSVHSSCHKWR